MFPSPNIGFALAALALSIPSVQGGGYAVPYIPATYDYIVVGGGTAGLTLASRLAENSSISVAVIEAGGDYELEFAAVAIPGTAALLATGSDPTDLNPLIDWGFVTQKMAVCEIVHYNFSTDDCNRVLEIEQYITLAERHWEGRPHDISWYIRGKSLDFPGNFPAEHLQRNQRHLSAMG